MSRLVWALTAGVLFGAGLVISGLSDPEKVIGFLDVAGAWDPSLIVVMVVASAVAALGFRLAWKRSKPVSEQQFDLPTIKVIDGRLLGGAVLFGLGWGMTGYCPGPAITAAAINPTEGIVFLVAMLAGQQLFALVNRR